jgi:TonB family protein
MTVAAAVAAFMTGLALADEPARRGEPRLQLQNIDIRICLAADGQLAEEPSIEKSSGSPFLDERALRTVRSGDGKHDGKSVEKCFVHHISTHGNPGHGFPQSQDFYTTESQRQGDQGAVDVAVCYRPDGTLADAPAIARSSGIRRLDNSALRLAIAANGKYVPGTDDDGRPIASCMLFRVTYSIRTLP